MIKFAQFIHPASIGGASPVSYYSRGKAGADVVVTERAGFLVFADGKAGKQTRVPLTNVAFVEDDVETAAPPMPQKGR